MTGTGLISYVNGEFISSCPYDGDGVFLLTLLLRLHDDDCARSYDRLDHDGVHVHSDVHHHHGDDRVH